MGEEDVTPELKEQMQELNNLKRFIGHLKEERDTTGKSVFTSHEVWGTFSRLKTMLTIMGQNHIQHYHMVS